MRSTLSAESGSGLVLSVCICPCWTPRSGDPAAAAGTPGGGGARTGAGDAEDPGCACGGNGATVRPNGNVKGELDGTGAMASDEVRAAANRGRGGMLRGLGR